MADAVGILDRAIAAEKGQGCVCPRCKKRMKLMKFGENLELDHCGTCGLMWFDRGEHEALPQREERELAREAAGNGGPDLTVETGLKFRAGMNPYEHADDENSGFPIFTALLVLAFVIVTHLAKAHHFRGYVFDAARPFTQAGIPAVLSIFAHADKWHLMGNAVFFFLPAAMIESAFGEKVLLQVFFFAAFAALLVEAVFQGQGLSLGASAGISGVYAVLCLTRPHAVHVTQDHGFFQWPASFYTITYRTPMWMVFLGWIGSQLFGLWGQQLGDKSDVSYLSHLVGAGAGLIYVLGSDLKALSPRVGR
jgi:membrane associated rhomboid family serine protease